MGKENCISDLLNVSCSQLVAGTCDSRYLNSIWQKQVVLHLPIGLWLCIPVHGYVYRGGRVYFGSTSLV